MTLEEQSVLEITGVGVAKLPCQYNIIAVAR